MGKFVFSFAVSSMFAIAAASAATPGAGLADFSGKVLVDQGAGFVPATTNMRLHAGDRIFVGKDSVATVNYDECSLAIRKATVYPIATEAPCANGQKTASLSEPAATGNVMITPAHDEDDGFSAGDVAGYAAGGAIVIAAAAVAIFRPISKF